MVLMAKEASAKSHVTQVLFTSDVDATGHLCHCPFHDHSIYHHYLLTFPSTSKFSFHLVNYIQRKELEYKS